MWVSVYGSARLSRIDPATNQVTTSIPVGASPCGLAIGAGSVWIDGYGTNTIERVNPRTRKVRPIRVGSAPFDVAYAFGAVWSTDNGSRQVSRIDPRTNRVVRVIRTGGAPAGLAVTRDAGRGRIHDRRLRVPDRPAHERVPPDPRRRHLTAWLARTTRRSGSRTSRAASSFASTRRRERLARVEVGPQPVDGTVAADGSAWFPLRGADQLVRIDPSTNKVVERVPVGTTPFVVNEAFGDLWVPATAAPTSGACGPDGALEEDLERRVRREPRSRSETARWRSTSRSSARTRAASAG